MTELEKAIALREEICRCLPDVVLESVDGNRWAAALLGYDAFKTVDRFEHNVFNCLSKKDVLDKCSMLPIMRDSAKLYNLILYLAFTQNAGLDDYAVGAPVLMLEDRYALSRFSVLLLAKLFNFELVTKTGVEVLVPKETGAEIPEVLPEIGNDPVQWLVRCSFTFDIPVTRLLKEAMLRDLIPVSLWFKPFNVVFYVSEQMFDDGDCVISRDWIADDNSYFEWQKKLISVECTKPTEDNQLMFSAANLFMLHEETLKKLSSMIGTNTEEYLSAYFGMCKSIYTALNEAYKRTAFVRDLDWDNDFPSINSYGVYSEDAANEEAKYQ